MSLITVTLIIVIGIGAGIINAICGFGSGVLAMSVWPYLFPLKQAVAASAMCGCTTALTIAVLNWRHISFKKLLPCAITGLIAATLAVHFSVGAAEKVMVRALGILLIAMSCYSTFWSKSIHIKGTPLSGMIAGAIGGILSGLFAVGGPPIALYMIAVADNNDEYRATVNSHFFCTTFMSTVVRWREGIVTGTTLQIWLVALAGLAIGLFIGNKIFHMLDAQKLRKVVYGFLAIAGLNLLCR